MRKIIVFFSAFVFLSGASSVFSATKASVELVRLLTKLGSVQAAFVQTTRDAASHRLLQKSQGKMAFKRPNQFRWDILSPNQQVVLTNGKWLWVYDKALKQVTKQKAARMQLSVAGILSGNTRTLLSHFTVTFHQDKSGRKIFKLVPIHPKGQAFLYVKIIFLHQQLQGLVVKNQLNQLNYFQFSNVVTNASFPAGYFDFHAPPGVDVLDS